MQRFSGSVAKFSSSTAISGAVNEISETQISSLNLGSTSYNIEIKGTGVATGDINLYNVIATKVIA